MASIVLLAPNQCLLQLVSYLCSVPVEVSHIVCALQVVFDCPLLDILVISNDAGHWGGGAFQGDRQLKAVLQLMAAAVTKRPLLYYTFEDVAFANALSMLYAKLRAVKVTVGTFILPAPG